MSPESLDVGIIDRWAAVAIGITWGFRTTSGVVELAEQQETCMAHQLVGCQFPVTGTIPVKNSAHVFAPKEDVLVLCDWDL